MPSSSGAKKTKSMPKKSLQHFEKRLLEERRRVLKELGYYDETFGNSMQDSDGDLSSYSFHMADQGTDAMEREKAFLMASKEGRFLWHIDQALRRLYKSPETFGKCHQCGNDIALERLDALPHARYCFDCKQREEDAKK
jgi:DnaK suppressor protein